MLNIVQNFNRVSRSTILDVMGWSCSPDIIRPKKEGKIDQLPFEA